VFRILRVARLTRALKSIRMVRRVKGIARLVDTLVVSIPAMTNVASLCFLVIFIFTVMGMDFYGSDDIDQEYVNGMYNQHANFRYFGDGFMLLFRTVTGEAWNGVMHDIMVAECDQKMNPLEKGDNGYSRNFCGAPHNTAWIFFIVFQVFVTGLLFELITAIVLDEFAKMNNAENLPVNPDMISNFNDHWAQLDPKATQLIPQHKLAGFLKQLNPPIFDNPVEASSEIFKMNINSTAGKGGINYVNYVDTLVAVVRYTYVKTIGEECQNDLDVAMIESPELTARIVQSFPHLKEITKMTPKDFGKELAATKMQNIYMRRKAWKRIKDKRVKVEVELANLRSGSTNVHNIDIPDDIKAMTAEEVMCEIRQRGGSVVDSEEENKNV
jgi:hypothetical protein